MLDFKKQERSKEVAALEAAKQECQTDLTEMQEQLETAQTAVEAAEQRVQKAELTYQKQSRELNKLAPIMEEMCIRDSLSKPPEKFASTGTPTAPSARYTSEAMAESLEPIPAIANG